MVGLSGGIGSGKTTAAAFFEEAGAEVVRADELAHAVLHSRELQQPIEEAFGRAVFDDQGRISHARLAESVFNQPQKRVILNNLVHPRVQRRFQQIVAQLEAGRLLVYDVPLLFEKHLEEQFDLTVVISAPQQVRRRRVKQRSNWSHFQFQSREAAQLSLAEKERRANLVIFNQKGRAELKEAIWHLYQEIMRKNSGNR